MDISSSSLSPQEHYHQPMPPQKHYPYMQPSPTPTAVSQHYINEKEYPSPETINNKYNPTSYDNDYNQLEKGINHNSNNNHIEEDVLNKKKKKGLKDRNWCIRCCCCSRLPKWARYVIWIIIIAIIIVVIIIGSIFATFKMPTFNMEGLDNNNSTTPTDRNRSSSPPSASFSLSDGSINFKFALNININNPNIFPLHFADMRTTAYYPIPEDSGIKTNITKIRIGAGYLESIWIPKQTNMTFSYPFEIQYDPSLDVNQFLLNSLTDKCGLTGEEPEDLSIQYDIQLAASALFVTIHPTISSSAQFKCPLADGLLNNVAVAAID
ncbi:unnamed protein product [Cunninghamella echinulata]